MEAPSENETPHADANVAEAKFEQVQLADIIHGFNYRRKPFDLTKLADDIRAKGLINPITVRHHPDEPGKYQLIAGNCREAAFRTVYGEDARIPAMVRDLTDEEAIALMIGENHARADTTAIEDAEAAARLLGLLQGNRKETAKRLGWSDRTLNSRLGIMHAIQSVRDAFIADEILLGHLEILAALPPDAQAAGLGQIRKIHIAGQTITVEKLKEFVSQILAHLKSAIFDKADCQSCHYRTGNQHDLFENHFENGESCTNPSCYQAKTDEELEIRKERLVGGYQVVRIVRAEDASASRALQASGQYGVGDAQLQDCKMCAHYGAMVSAIPNSLGAVVEGVCFNLKCNDQKVSEHQKATRAASSAKNKAQAPGANAPASTTAGSVGSPAPTAAKSAGASAPKPAGASAPPPVTVRSAIKEYQDKVIRAAYQAGALLLNPPQSRMLLIALCMSNPRALNNWAASESIALKLENPKLKSATLDAGTVLKQFMELDQGDSVEALNRIPAYLAKDYDLANILGLMGLLKINLMDHWAADLEFWELLQKSEIDAVCIDLGIDKALGGKYTKLKAGSKADFVKALVELAPDAYPKKIPKILYWTR